MFCSSMLKMVKKCTNREPYVQRFCEEPKSDLEMEAILSAAKQQNHQGALIECNGKHCTDNVLSANVSPSFSFFIISYSCTVRKHIIVILHS